MEPSRGSIWVKNLASEKKVTAVYTIDGWVTVKTAPATFSLRENANGFEHWHYTFPQEDARAPRIEFAVAYEVLWQTTRDNNYGRNFVITNGVPLP